jgi:hypothetical protein
LVFSLCLVIPEALAKGTGAWRQLPTAICQLLLLNFLVPCVLAAPLAELLELKPPRGGLLVLGGRVVPLFAIAAL